MTWIRSLKLSRTPAPGSSPPRRGCFSSISLTLPPCLSPLTSWSTCLTAAVLLLHHLHGVSPLEGWTRHQLFLVTIIIAAKFLCEYPSLPRNGWWSIGLFEAKELNRMEAEFCQHLDWRVVISGPELESFLAFSQWFFVSS